MSRAKLRRYFRHGLFPQLTVFEAVARLGSVTRAAGELHLAQPTVSTQLKKLSQSLELALFEPRGRRLHLTPAGESLREVCAELLELFTRAEEKLSPFRFRDREFLRLAAEPEARPIAARLLAEFCARHPGVQATLHIAERSVLLERLDAGEDDVLLVVGRSAAAFVREALMNDAYNSPDEPGEKAPWNSRANTTPR